MTNVGETSEASEELARILRRVRKLITFAEAPISATDEEQIASTKREQDNARAQADALMLKFAIDQATLDASRPAEERGKPSTIEVETAASFSEENTAGYVDWLCTVLARHCRCLVKSYVRYDRETHTWINKVYGFEGDLRYFEVLFTTARLHMLEAVRPRYQANLTLEENAYRLHNAGYNWLEICGMQGWQKAKGILTYDGMRRLEDRHPDMLDSPNAVWYIKNYGKDDEEVAPATKIGSNVKRAYHRAVEAKGEKPTVISANGAVTYRRSAMNGYVTRLQRRVWRLETAREAPAKEGEIVLASQHQRLEDFFRDDNSGMYSKCPRCQKLSSNPYECEFCGQYIKERPQECEKCKAAKSGHCRDHPKGSSNYRTPAHDDRAYQRGAAHADTFDLAGSRSTGNTKHEIG